MGIKNDKGEAKGGVVITGGNGLIGRSLVALLENEGHPVSVLSRNPVAGKGSPKQFFWNPQSRKIDPASFDGVETVIHLAGENIAGGRWTKKRREAIISSRVDTGKFLGEYILGNNNSVKSFITSSAVGFYGAGGRFGRLSESDEAGDDFLAETCVAWESVTDLFRDSGIRTAAVRTSVVLHRENPAIIKLNAAAGIGIFPVLGNGTQPFPWIHMEDLCRLYLHVASNQHLQGAFNAVAPEKNSLTGFVRELKRHSGRRGVVVPIPDLLLRIAMGDMADIVLKGNNISADKIISSGFEFKYPTAAGAISSALS